MSRPRPRRGEWPDRCPAAPPTEPPAGEAQSGPMQGIVSAGADVLARAAWCPSGLPPQRVSRAGTIPGTARFRDLLRTHLGVVPPGVHARIVGEHGESEVPRWSLVGGRLGGRRDAPAGVPRRPAGAARPGGGGRPLPPHAGRGVPHQRAQGRHLLRRGFRAAAHRGGRAARSAHGSCPSPAWRPATTAWRTGGGRRPRRRRTAEPAGRSRRACSSTWARRSGDTGQPERQPVARTIGSRPDRGARRCGSRWCRRTTTRTRAG